MIMKQKVAVLGLVFILATVLTSFFCTNYSAYTVIYILIGIVLVTGVMCYINRKNTVKYILVSGIILVGAINFYMQYSVMLSGIAPLHKTTNTVVGVVTDVYERQNGYKTLSVHLQKGYNEFVPFDMTVQISTYESVDIGEWIKSSVTLEKTMEQTGSFEYNGNLSKKIYLMGYVNGEIQQIEEKTNTFASSVTIFFNTMVEEISHKIDFYINNKEAGALKALILGEKSDMDYGVGLDFSYAGLAHVLAISGMHISILALLLKLFFDRLSFHVYVSNTAIIVLVWIFVLLTGVSYSTLRSAIMITISLVAYNIGQYSDSINSLSISAVIIIACNPFAIFDMGLTLSVLATLGTIVFSNKVSKFIERFREDYKILRIGIVVSYIRSVAITLGATVFLLPFYVIVFKNINLSTLFTNFLITPILFGIICVGFVFILITIPFIVELGFLYAFLGQIINSLCEVMIWLVDITARITIFAIPLRNDIGVIWMCVTTLVIVYLIVKKIPLRTWVAGGFCVVYVGCGVALLQWYNFNTVEIVTFSSDKAGAIAIVYQNRADVIKTKSDGFLEYDVTRYLRQRGVSRIENYIDLDSQTEDLGEDSVYLIDKLNVRQCYYRQTEEDMSEKEYTFPFKFDQIGRHAVPTYPSPDIKSGNDMIYWFTNVTDDDKVETTITVNIFDQVVSIEPNIYMNQDTDLTVFYDGDRKYKQSITADKVISFDGVPLDKTNIDEVYDESNTVYRAVIQRGSVVVNKEKK